MGILKRMAILTSGLAFTGTAALTIDPAVATAADRSGAVPIASQYVTVGGQVHQPPDPRDRWRRRQAIELTQKQRQEQAARVRSARRELEAIQFQEQQQMARVRSARRELEAIQYQEQQQFARTKGEVQRLEQIQSQVQRQRLA